MTWLVLTCPVQLPGQKEQIVKRRFNMDNALCYEPNADGGTSIILQGVGGILQVVESTQQIDAALFDVTHPQRVEEQVERSKRDNPSYTKISYLTGAMPPIDSFAAWRNKTGQWVK